MKLIKKAGKTTVKMSRQEWTDMGKKSGWIKEAFSPILMFFGQMEKDVIPLLISDPDFPEITTEESALHKLRSMEQKDLKILLEKYNWKWK